MAFTFKVFKSLSECAPLEAFWKAQQWHPNADWDFYRTIIETKANVTAPCVIAAYQHEKIVALAAGRLETEKLSLGLGYAKFANPGVRQLAVINGGFMGQWELSSYREFLGFLATYLKAEDLDVALLAQVRLKGPLHQALQEAPVLHRARPHRNAALHWLMRLPPTWAEFLQSRSKKHRYWLKRLSNILDRDYPGKWSMQRYTTGEESGPFLEAAEKIADTTYHRGLGVGIRADEQNRRRLQLEAQRGQLRGYLLFLQDKPCAFWYCSLYGKTLHLCTTGYDSSLRHYELGTVLLMKVFQDHCGEIDSIDFGLGDAGYKQRFGTENYTETSFYLFKRSFRGGFLSLLFLIVSRGNDSVRFVLDKLQLTQRTKTLWRRLFVRKAEKAPAQGALPKDNATTEEE